MAMNKKKVIRTAKSFVTKKYNHSDCAEIAIKAGGASWFRGKGVAWCDICVSAILYRAGFSKEELYSFGFPQASINTKKARTNGIFHYTKDLKNGSKIPTGALVLFRWNGADDDNFDHIGILISNTNGKYITVEGNASDDGLVHYYTRDKKYIKAYIYPDYKNSKTYLKNLGYMTKNVYRATSQLLKSWGYPIEECASSSKLLIKCWQKHLSNFGYYKKTIDGILRTKGSLYSYTIAGTQKLLIKKGFFKGSVTGKSNADFIKAFRKYLNAYIKKGIIEL